MLESSMKVTQNLDPPSDDTGDGPQTSVWTISNRTFFGSLGVFVKAYSFLFAHNTALAKTYISKLQTL